jgi:hypothetical protein
VLNFVAAFEACACDLYTTSGAGRRCFVPHSLTSACVTVYTSAWRTAVGRLGPDDTLRVGQPVAASGTACLRLHTR